MIDELNQKSESIKTILQPFNLDKGVYPSAALLIEDTINNGQTLVPRFIAKQKSLLQESNSKVFQRFGNTEPVVSRMDEQTLLDFKDFVGNQTTVTAGIQYTSKARNLIKSEFGILSPFIRGDFVSQQFFNFKKHVQILDPAR